MTRANNLKIHLIEPNGSGKAICHTAVTCYQKSVFADAVDIGQFLLLLNKCLKCLKYVDKEWMLSTLPTKLSTDIFGD